ncbi:hypothetical protein ACH5RR_040475 [Cinchona calisaya]|uniref:Uncharacterized protein n=1 Tax=Cinchona calisaya TaxID=153742 RepID=A0ABD2XSF3_9GENT
MADQSWIIDVDFLGNLTSLLLPIHQVKLFLMGTYKLTDLLSKRMLDNSLGTRSSRNMLKALMELQSVICKRISSSTSRQGVSK